LLTREVVEAAAEKVNYIAFGIDLGSRAVMPAYAELAVLFDVRRGSLRYTGKSLARSDQTRLVDWFVAGMHTMRVDIQLLMLVCHDLNFFSPRALAVQGHQLERFRARAIQAAQAIDRPPLTSRNRYASNVESRLVSLAQRIANRPPLGLRYRALQPDKQREPCAVDEGDRSDGG
jgi:hypothetical protein